MKTLVYYLKSVMITPLKITRLLLFFSLAIAVTTACKKDEPEEIPPDSSPVQQLSKDDYAVEVTMDETFTDIGQVLTTPTYKIDIPCGATLDSVVTVNNKVYYYVTYDGLNCQETKYRKGQIVIEIKKNDSWLQKNTMVDVEFINYEVTNVLNNNQMLINGTSDLKNISGGIPALLGSGLSTVIHRVNSNIDINFNGGPDRDWKLHKMMVYSGSQGNLQLAVNGFGNQQGQNNLMSWGTDSQGRKFFNRVDESIVYKQSCQWLPCSGIQEYQYPQEGLTATVTFGYNDNNQPISGTECPTRYRIDWQQYGQSGTIYLPLFGN
jgi:hypothetical protein